MIGRVLLRLLALAFLLAAASARADTPIALWKAFDGRVNFTGTQVSVRAGSNSNAPCTIYAPGTNRSATLTIPYGATVLSAQLYWAGSGTSDYTVTFEGKDVTATRKFSSATVGNGFNYFGGAADVTATVKAKGGGTYNFSGLTVANGAPWCASQGVLGGFSLLVVYSHPSEPERVLNLYEGFRYVQNGEVVVKASNFRWNRTAYSVKEKARIGHITWEGDPTLAQDGERLLFEGTEMTDSYNPAGNQFNSSSNINGSSNSYGIDFDAYDTSVTIWSGYDAAVTTSYQAGQDMVILNAEILVVPTLPVADLAIKIARAGALKIGTDVEYKVTVTNNGPYTEAGTITVTNTLPPGMYYTSGTINGWSCSATTTSGTCTYKGGLAPGASAPPLTVYARVTSTGEKTNTVKVSGTATDDNLANNSASDTGTATNVDGTTTPPPAPSIYVFTDSVCKAGVAINAANQCRDYSAATVGGKETTIYLTSTRNGLPATPNASSDTAVAMEFMLECNNPAQGTVESSFGPPGTVNARTAIPVCARQGALASWSKPINVSFPKGVISVPYTLIYKDVGKIRLNLRTGGTLDSTEVFVSAPARIAFRRIAWNGVANPGVKTPGGNAFAPAGATLTIETEALLYDDKSPAPNFGNEDNPQATVALRPAPAAGVTLAVPGELKIVERPAWGDGTSKILASFSEVGAFDLVAGLADPADIDNQDPAKAYNLYFGVKVLESSATVGRFYPAYFRTETTGPFDCPASLPARFACLQPAAGAVYSQQSFDVKVKAYSLDNQPVLNFRDTWFKTVTLSAASTKGGSALAGLSSTPIKTANSADILGKASFRLAQGYNDAQPRAAGVTDPTTIFIRAVSSDTNGTAFDITSQRTGVVSDEDDILVLNGRLKLANALGSDSLRTPVALRTEYYAGTGANEGWLLNPGYTDPLGAGGAPAAIVSCTPDFADGKACTDVIGASAGQAVALNRGSGVLWLRAPGKRQNGATRGGSVTLRYNGWTWLPSTTGRVSFGSHRSPVIYVREMFF